MRSVWGVGASEALDALYGPSIGAESARTHLSRFTEPRRVRWRNGTRSWDEARRVVR